MFSSENSFQLNVKNILLIANVLLVIFLIWFSNIGLLPFVNLGDFIFFSVLAFALALYRPGWTFLIFIGTIALENITLIPKEIGLTIRPYQLLGVLILLAVCIRFFAKRLNFNLPKLKWYDAVIISFGLFGFLSLITATDNFLSLKLSIITCSFIFLYFLTRIFIQEAEDFFRIIPFFVSASVIIIIYGLWQNLAFFINANSFEVMPGRPNATFAEPDWLGAFLVFLLASVFSLIYHQSKKTKNQNFQFLNYFLLFFVFIVLILTVSRSAWLGAIFVTILFLKIILTDGSLRISEWDWKKFLYSLAGIIIIISISVGIIYIFNLSRFQIWNRAASTGGLQKITISCMSQGSAVPEKIGTISELEQYECKHINLEDIEKEKFNGNNILEIYRTDPNVSIRAEIYKKSIEQIKQHPVLGIGWGNISNILGKDERGAGLNASNIFLEVWLGSGLLGILSFTILIFYVFIKSATDFLSRKNENKTIPAFIMLGWAAIIIPNLFNSGIFLGFIWIYIAIALSLIKDNE